MINLIAHAGSPLAVFTGGIQSDGHAQSSRHRSTSGVDSLVSTETSHRSLARSQPRQRHWIAAGIFIVAAPCNATLQPHRLPSASLCQQQRRKPKMHCSNRTCLASTTLWTSACSCWTGAARLTTEHHSTISWNGPPFRRPDQQETMAINHHGLTNKTMKKRELEKISRVQECFGAREWRRKW